MLVKLLLTSTGFFLFLWNECFKCCIFDFICLKTPSLGGDLRWGTANDEETPAADRDGRRQDLAAVRGEETPAANRDGRSDLAAGGRK
jgi:hypothetical protein